MKMIYHKISDKTFILRELNRLSFLLEEKMIEAKVDINVMKEKRKW